MKKLYLADTKDQQMLKDEETNHAMTLQEIIVKQQEFFRSGKTLPLSYRKKKLKALKNAIVSYEVGILTALHEDFGKSAFESVLSETGIVLSELRLTIRKLQQWAAPQRVSSKFLNFPSSDLIYSEPFGNMLVIAPWNYPFQLSIAPLVGAVAAGNTVLLKPSELTPATSAIVAKILSEVFDPGHLSVVQGDAKVAQSLLERRWDHIFFTGSIAVGKIVAKAAAIHLTPCTLELGGKNPCIVHQSAPIRLSAKRIVWGKFLNGGQTCIAPDFILVDERIKEQLVSAIEIEIQKAYGDNPQDSEDFPRIINQKNFKRLIRMLEREKIIIGGESNERDLYLAPTLVDEPSLERPLMQEEIFGPILPILSYSEEREIRAIIGKFEKPLSLYVFARSRAFIKKTLRTFSFGGGTVNDTVIHFANPRLPFGGVGHSGMGAYHGKYSFDTFSHKKSIVRKAKWLDVPVRYAPYKRKMGLLRFFMRFFG